MNEEVKMTKEEIQEKKKEINESLEQMETQYNELRKTLEELNAAEGGKPYRFKIGSKNTYKEIVNFVNKDIPWNLQSLNGLTLLYSDLDSQKEWVNNKAEYDETIELKAYNILNLHSALTKGKVGKGYVEARSFIDLWNRVCGGFEEVLKEIEKAFEPIAEKEKELKQLEDKVRATYQELAQINLMEETEE